MSKIYVVDHIHEYYCEPQNPQKKYLDLKGIGNFYSLKEAEQAITKCKTLKGFKEHPDGFRITEFTLDSVYNQQINVFLCKKSNKIKTKKIFALYSVLESEEDEDAVMLLGIFTSKKNAVNARKAILINNLLKHLSDNLKIFEESVGKVSWEEGFITWEESIKVIPKD